MRKKKKQIPILKTENEVTRVANFFTEHGIPFLILYADGQGFTSLGRGSNYETVGMLSVALEERKQQCAKDWKDVPPHESSLLGSN